MSLGGFVDLALLSSATYHAVWDHIVAVPFISDKHGISPGHPRVLPKEPS